MAQQRGRHRRRRQVPLLLGGIAAMFGGAVLAFAVIAAPVLVAGVLLLAATAWALRR